MPSKLAGYYEKAASLAPLRFVVRWTFRAALFALLILVWEWIVDLGLVRELIVPRPTSIWPALKEVVTHSSFPENLRATMTEIAAGFGIGSGAGLFLAIMLTMFPLLRPLVADYITALQAIPKVTLIPVLVTALGFGLTSKIVLAALISFFPVYITGMVGMNTVGDDYLKLMTGLRTDRFQRMIMLQFPHALPTLFAGFKNAITGSLIGAIVAEYFGAEVGLGKSIVTHVYAIRVAHAFAVLGILSLIGVILFYGVDWVGKRVCFWVRS